MAGTTLPANSIVRIAIEALLEELPSLRRCSAKIEYVDSFLVRGPHHLEAESRTLRRRSHGNHS